MVHVIHRIEEVGRPGPSPDCRCTLPLWDELVNAREQVDLLAPIPHIDAARCREPCIVANHNSYHAGQLLLLRKMVHGVPDGRDAAPTT